MLIAYCTFMTMLPYITDGLKNTPPVLIRASTSLGATQFQIFTRVMIPNAMPNLFVGMKVTLAMTFGALMVSEMLGASKGLGYMIINAKQWFNIIRQEFSFLCRWEMNCKKNIKNTCSVYENMV